MGPGAETRRILGQVILGGVIAATFLTLLLVPVVYSLLARFTKAKRVVGEEDEPAELEGGATEALGQG